ncbi:fatty acid synthase-like isoform X2 [Formica exsecta]|uniref:fatty acid synthase-like isoform X2 n=1 Tax=Formica exsecta TaxID=72781 RepID=UPI0011420541|nr:fatty acid synthase-like isoform X2 [Formica exsecta]
MMKETYRPCINIDSGKEIVISGIAGRFPDSNNMNQLQENLLNKVNLLRADHCRWKIARRMGVINNVEKFDADFFNVPFKQVHTLEPMTRMLLEHTYEAIIDAGINPKQLRGKNTAVIIGTSFLESQNKFMYENLQVDGLGIVGCSKSTTANMISNLLDLKGPSYTVDTACSSSLYAMALGYRDIMSGRCEDAIIGTSQLCLNPVVTLQFSRLGVLSSDGYCKPFDNAASGYSRSETVSVLYLQKAKNAKRIYATCKHIKINSDGYKEEGIMYPSTHVQSNLLTEFYKECGILPSCLDYIEAHGTATRAGDPVEVNALYNVLCKNRNTPLMMGSVKSNLGHAEPASGFTQIAKVIIAFETGLIPPNINYTSPRNDIDALVNGTIQVVTEAMPLNNGYIGINSFGFGGSNAHMLLKWNIKQKVNNAAPSDGLSRLVTLSGRTEESINLFLNDVANHSTDAEYIRLLHDIHADNIEGHPWRGYIILDTLQKNSIKEINKDENNKNVKRPIWFIFSALGAQWPRMGRNLLKFHAFAKAVKMCDTILKSYDINIMNILTNEGEKACESALHTLVGIIAIQVGLVDLLTSLEITADYMISHSAGELGCAYADKCLTIEQTILSAYFIGLACVEGNAIHSSMAVVNLDYECLKNICPADIEIVCYNSQNSNIVSGPAESIKEFVKKLQINNINVKEISCDIPYHSHYLASVETRLLHNLNQVIPRSKKRSSRWISTSIPCIEWSNEISKLSSANYHTHSILNTVLFEQATNLIPNNAVTIEIAPDGVLQHILKESLHPKVANIVLTQRTEQNTTDVTLQGIGKLYNCGLQPQIANLYPPVEFPVSRGTPMISPSIKWDHSEDWFVTTYQSQKHIQFRERQVEINLNDENYDYMVDHVIGGRNLLPATGYLALVWETIGMMKGKIYTTMPIIFRDISFIRATHLSNNVKLTITIQEGSGRFEIIEGDSVVVIGTVHTVSNPEQEMIPTNLLPEDDNKKEHMTARDIYKELKLRGYQYNGKFRGLKSASISGNKGHIAWENNWVTFMDTMLQLYILGNDRDLYVPTNIKKLVIDPALHLSKLREITTEEDKQLSIRIYREIGAIISGGIEIRGVEATVISRQKITQDPIIEEYIFVAHHDRVKISLSEAIQISAQLALEDHQIIKVKAIELIEDIDNIMLEELSSLLLIKTLSNMPLIQADITLLTSLNRFNPVELPQNVIIADLNKPSIDDKVLIAIGFNLLTKQQNSLEKLLPFVREGGYLLTREKCNIINYDKYLRQYELNVILEKRTETELIVLLKKKVQVKKTAVVYINNDNFNWLEDLKLLMNDENQLDKDSRIIIVGEADLECGLLGFVNCLRKESGGELVRGVLIQDQKAPKFSLQNPFYKQQLQKDMTINVLRSNKTWGSYRHLHLPRPEAKPVPTAYVSQMVRGDLSTFCWIENDISVDSHLKDLIHVIYSSINFKDVMLATAKLNLGSTAISQGRFQNICLGIEYVGFDTNGRRVMGLCDNKCIANVVVKDKDLCWNILDTWTFEEAATVPCVYSTCYFALYICGKMKKGDKILIHSGTGGIGQAAIHLALREGCEVFTTVGTNEKREFIKETFPAIMDEHIGNSRDTSFEQLIMLQTNGRGVDIVLNSLAEEKLIASIRCLARNGRFLEIGKFDLVSNNPLDLIVFQKGISFHGILLENMFVGRHKYKFLLSKMMANGLKNGSIKPLQVKVFPKSEIETAFRYMASGKHIGKIILKIQEEDQPLNGFFVAHRRYYCLSDRSYIILGGLGGFGLELTDWLILRGAKNVVLISRTGIKNGYQRMKIQLWKSYGVNVLIVTNIDCANREDCKHLLRIAEEVAPVDAIFNLAVVLKDRILKNQTPDTFAESFKSKAWATQMLDELSRKICSKLQHFVMFSSVSCGRGNAGQTNYGMANSVMERVCEKRAKDGLPGLAIQWGAIGDVGLVADMQEEDKELVIGGTLQQKISSCLDELDTFLIQSRPVVSSMVVAEKKVGSSGFDNIAETIANILNINDMNMISQNTSLAELGIDSMMVVEIKQTMEREFDIHFTPKEIRNLTFAKLNKMSNANTGSDNTQAEKSIDTRKPDVIKLFSIVNDEHFMTEICLDISTKKKENMVQVFLIPGIEGCGAIFNHLASSIKFSLTFLQYGTNNIDATNIILDTTDYLLEHVLSRLKDGKDFVMVGYSFGSIIAIELARRLETMKFKGRLVLIDGAPEQIRMMNEHYMPSSSDVEHQIDILNIIMEIYDIKIREKVLEELKKCKTWEERFDVFAKHFLEINTLLSPINLKTLCTTVYKHSAAIRQYNPSTLPRIKSPITLLKPTLSDVYKIEEDYGLHKVTQSKVEVHYIEGNHLTILRNEKVAAAINGEIL